jgi:hypothetical protein
MTTIAVHQPNYLPWIGYFEKISHSDVFVLLDDVEFSSRSWTCRNRIKTPDGWTWLTVPVTGSTSRPVREIEIATDQDWRSDHWKTLTHNYGGAPYFDDLKQVFESTYDREWESLDRLNVHLLEALCDLLDFEYEFVRQSALDVEGQRTDLILDICGRLDADRYYSGAGGRDYNDEDRFAAAGIDLTYQSIEHPEYPQRFGEFVPSLSFVDVMFNVGPDEARELVRSL